MILNFILFFVLRCGLRGMQTLTRKGKDPPASAFHPEYKHEPPRPLLVLLRMEPRAWRLSKYSTY